MSNIDTINQLIELNKKQASLFEELLHSVTSEKYPYMIQKVRGQYPTYIFFKRGDTHPILIDYILSRIKSYMNLRRISKDMVYDPDNLLKEKIQTEETI
jgi:hypothetical protein